MRGLSRVLDKYILVFVDWALLLTFCLLIWNLFGILFGDQDEPIDKNHVVQEFLKEHFKEPPENIYSCFYSDTSKYTFDFPSRKGLIKKAFFPNETNFLRQHQNLFPSSKFPKDESEFLLEWIGDGSYPYVPANTLKPQQEIPLQPLCSLLSPFFNKTIVGTEGLALQSGLEYVQNGGSYSPGSCNSRYKVAVIIPYRGRPEQLGILLNKLHPFLQRQQLEYTIFVTEQSGNFRYFNKGILLNAAFLLIMNNYKNPYQKPFDCIIFHDVDLIPLNDHNYYYCSKSNPRHLSVAVDSLNNSLPYSCLIGGVLSISPKQYCLVNGYSNLYWRWGGEDDDFYNRLAINGISVKRPDRMIARYAMLQHERRILEERATTEQLLRTSKKRFTIDGLSTARFRLIAYQQVKLYTHFVIDVGKPYNLRAAEEFAIKAKAMQDEERNNSISDEDYIQEDIVYDTNY